MTESTANLDLAMLKHGLQIEISMCEVLNQRERIPMLEQSMRAVGMLEVAIGAHAAALTQIQELVSEVATLRAMLNG